MLSTIIPLFIQVRWVDGIDIVLVAILLYQIYNLVKGSAAINIFIGMLLIYLLWIIVKALDMQLFSGILGKFIDVGVIMLVVLFQQEIRKFLLYIGTTEFFKKNTFRKNIFDFKFGASSGTSTDITPIIKACRNMSETKTGAILVITKNSNLKFYSDTGDQLDAKISSRMIENIFFKNSPLHDGAVIIANNKIKAARCVLPVTERNDFPAHLGMRHRAAVGITEASDAVAIVVSEQTGEISYSKGGELKHSLTAERLKELLENDLNL